MQNYISTTRTKQKQYFHSAATLALPFRKQMLHKLLHAMKQYEQPLAEALWTDLHKSYEEAYLTELSIVYGEIRNHLRHLSRWAPTLVGRFFTTEPPGKPSKKQKFEG